MISKQDIIGMLNKYGIMYEDMGDYIHIPTQKGKYEIRYYEVKDVTPLRLRFKKNVVNTFTYRAKSTFLDMGIEGIFRKKCIMYKDPQILFNLYPVELTNVKFHVSSLKFEGNVVNRFENKSEEGEIGVLKIFRLRQCPTDPSYYKWTTVEDSADLLGYWYHSAYEEDTNTPVIRNLRQELENKVKPNVSVTMIGHFETGGLSWDTFWNILRYITSGTLKLYNGFDVTINYYWKGAWQTEKKRVNVAVTLPVEGGVDIDW